MHELRRHTLPLGLCKGTAKEFDCNHDKTKQNKTVCILNGVHCKLIALIRTPFTQIYVARSRDYLHHQPPLPGRIHWILTNRLGSSYVKDSYYGSLWYNIAVTVYTQTPQGITMYRLVMFITILHTKHVHGFIGFCCVLIVNSIFM